MPTNEPLPTGEDAAGDAEPTDDASSHSPAHDDTTRPEGGGDPYYPDDSLYPSEPDSP